MSKVTDVRGRDHEGNWHMVDKGGNHFINGKCVNPQYFDEQEIGDTIPDGLTRSGVVKTGHIELREVNGKMFAL